MNYTKGHERALIKTVNSLPAKMRCLFCDSQHLEIGSVIDTTEYNDGISAALIQGASHIPFIQVMCSKCGYAHLFNAIALGVVGRNTGKLKEDKP